MKAASSYMIFLYSYVSRFWLCGNLCASAENNQNSASLPVRKTGEKSLQNQCRIFSILDPLERQKPGARSWAVTKGNGSTGCSWTLSFLKAADLAGSFAAPAFLFLTAFEALKKSKSSSHTALLPAFLGAQFFSRSSVTYKYWGPNTFTSFQKLIERYWWPMSGLVSGSSTVSEVKAQGNNFFFFLEGHIFSEAESVCDLLLKKKWDGQMERCSCIGC